MAGIRNNQAGIGREPKDQDRQAVVEGSALPVPANIKATVDRPAAMMARPTRW
jgi:hypothetical protein